MARTKISGIDRLNRKLAKIPVEAQKAIRAAMEKGADEIVEMAKRLVPTGDSGRLKESIGWTWSAKPPKGSIAIGTVGGGPDDLRIIVYAGDDVAFYARDVEFGTAAHTIKGRGKVMTDGTNFYGKGPIEHPGASPTPFFLPAYRAIRKRVRTRITRAVNKSARDVARGN